LKFDEVLNRQRTLVYRERRRVLEGEDLRAQILLFMDDTIEAYITHETAEGYPEEWDLDALWAAFHELYPCGVTPDELDDRAGGRAGLTAGLLVEAVTDDIHVRFEERESELGADALRDLERVVVLAVLDRKWREHLYEMDYLREGIGLRYTLGREPIFEYEREGFDLFTAMMDAIKEESVGYVFNLDTTADAPPSEALDAARRPDRLHYSAPTLDTAGGLQEGDLDAAPAEVPPGDAEPPPGSPRPPDPPKDRRRPGP
ncbi:preprotein translocase subunit SecA, partial [Streptomyces sp. NPDC056728]